MTVAALVLGLLTSSVVESFTRAANDLDAYAVELIGLGQSLQEFGPEADPGRSPICYRTEQVRCDRDGRERTQTNAT